MPGDARPFGLGRFERPILAPFAGHKSVHHHYQAEDLQPIGQRSHRLGLRSRIHQLVLPPLGLRGRRLPHLLGVFVGRGGGDGRAPLGRHFGRPRIRIGFGRRVAQPLLQLRAEPLARLEAPEQPNRMLPLARFGMTSIISTHGNGADAGIQGHDLIPGRLQRLATMRTDLPLLIGRLLQPFLQLLALPFPRFDFDGLLYLQQAGRSVGAHATSGARGGAAPTVCRRSRKCRCKG